MNTTMFGTKALSNIRNIAFYGRVSTEHEAQLSALENQMQWYDDQLTRHENWILQNKYIDRGITGTQAKNRTAFLQMIEDAKTGQFDLIVTREVCRFARNTVDTLQVTRELKKYNVEVYFVEDNIWTFSSDGELRLTIMAALAQEESRKVSERVLAGQKISRENGVLYGNGNILGYELYRNIDAGGKWNSKENTYVINEEQAETVRMIYNWYLEGKGTSQIAKELIGLDRRNAEGNCKWCASKISRILHNKTYAGYKVYNKSSTTDYLEHSRVNNLDRESYMYVKGDWEPIISEEKWNLVQEIMAKKTIQVEVRKNKYKTIGKKEVADIWKRKLVCKCGSTFRRNKWRVNKGSDEVIYGYQCYNQLNNGAASTRIKKGLSPEGFCDVKMVCDWKLDFMAKNIFSTLWNDNNTIIDKVIKLIEENYVDEQAGRVDKDIKNVEDAIEKKKHYLPKLLDMRMDGELTKDEFISQKNRIESEISDLQEQLTQFIERKEQNSNLDEKLSVIREELEKQVDFSNGHISEDIVEKYVDRIVADNGKFKWILNLSGEKYEMNVGVDGRKNKAKMVYEEKNVQCSQSGTGCYCSKIGENSIK